MKFERFSVKSCCGSSSISYKLYSTLHKDYLALFIENGFTEAKHFTESNILYIESANIIATGVFGSDKLQVKCKIKECEKYIENFEKILLLLE